MMRVRTPQRIVRAVPGALVVTIAMIAALGGARASAQGNSDPLNPGSLVVKNTKSGVTLRSNDGGDTWQRVDPADLTGGGATGSGGIRASIWPNPSSGSTAIRYTLDVPGDVIVTVSDMKGGVVARFDVGASARGDGAVIFNAATVPPGAYYYRVESDGQMSSGGILLVVR